MEKLNREDIRKIVDKSCKKYMKSVKKFLMQKAGGEIPEEWSCSLMLLGSYYKQFLDLDLQISQMDSVVVEGRYGLQVSPLCMARDKASARLEAVMKEMGLSMKAAISLKVVEPKKEQSVLDKFMKSKMEKKIETR